MSNSKSRAFAMAGAIKRAFQDDDEAVFALLKAVYVMSVEQDMRRCVAGCRGDADERATGPMSTAGSVQPLRSQSATSVRQAALMFAVKSLDAAHHPGCAQAPISE
jgi:hypothetical protein